MPAKSLFSLVLCDLGKVILPFDLRIATKAFEKESAVPSEEILRRVMGSSLDLDFEKGKISPEEFYQEVQRRIGLKLPYGRFVSLWNDIFSENKKVSTLIRRLKMKTPVAILSNTNVLHFEFVYKHFPIVREIEHYVLSYEVGVRKPDPEIFEAALERFRVPAPQTAYIDDREDFVVAARTLGLYGIHFRGEELLEKELLQLGLLTT